MATYYVEDYEELTGKKIPRADVTVKVVAPPAEGDAASASEAETKDK